MRQVPVDDAIGGFLQNPTEDSFVSVFQALYAPLYRYFMVRGLDSSTAEELVQDVLLTVYRRSSDVRNHLCFTGWLFQVARNSLLQHARKRRVVLESLTGREPTTRFRLPEESEIFDWIQALDEDEREICLMRYVDSLDYQSIAEALELPMGTVKWKLHQVKKKIAFRLGAGHMGKEIMNCGISDFEWTDYLDQALSFRDRQRIEAHLHVCANCRSEFDRLRQVDQRLRIECGLLRQSIHPSEESQVAAHQRVLAVLRESAPKGAHERLWRVRWVLALLCGSNTATRIIQSAESHASHMQPGEQNWILFLRRLSFLTTEICGSYAGDLIRAVGK